MEYDEYDDFYGPDVPHIEVDESEPLDPPFESAFTPEDLEYLAEKYGEGPDGEHEGDPY